VSHKRKDGTSLTILASVSAVKDFSGSIIGFVTVNRDITASKQAMEQLRQSEQRFRLLAEHAPDIIARFDRELRHLYVNPATVKVTGIPVEVYVGKTNRELGMPADLIASWDIYLRKVFETGQQQTLEFAFPSPIGVKHYQTLVVPEYDTHGSIMSVLCVSRDVTDLKQLQERVWKSEQQLQAIIDGSTALIYLTDMQGRYLLINSQYEKLFHVTKKQIVGKTAADLFPKEIADTFQAHDQEVLQVGTERAWEEGIPQDDGLHIYLSVKFPLFDPTGVPYAVCGISTDITERKELEKRAVQDCGIGIAREHQAKIFERFYRVGSTTDNTFPGLGMGLYISNGIVQQHGGSIWVNSAAGKGSTFSFSLPLRAKG